MSEITLQRMFTPWLHREFFFGLSELGRRHDQNLKILHGFTKRVIAEKKALLKGQDNTSGTVSSDEDASVGKWLLYHQL